MIISINDTTAAELIERKSRTVLFCHAETPWERELLRLVERSSIEPVYELRANQILAPSRNHLCFVRFPRLLVYQEGTSVVDLEGMEEIRGWLESPV